VIFLTSNLGGSQIADLMHGGMGSSSRRTRRQPDCRRKLQRTAVEAARRKFSPEFMNRLDKVVVFHPLKGEELDEVLDIELRQVQKRGAGLDDASLLVSNHKRRPGVPPGRGNRPKYGARHLKRAIERYVVYPIARLLATAQVHQGDALVIDHHLANRGLLS